MSSYCTFKLVCFEPKALSAAGCLFAGIGPGLGSQGSGHKKVPLSPLGKKVHLVPVTSHFAPQLQVAASDLERVLYHFTLGQLAVR